MFRDSYGLTGLGIMLVMILLVILLFGPFVWWGIKGNIAKCEQLDGSQYTHEWGLYTGCRVQRDDGMWVSIDDFYAPDYFITLE